MGMIGRNELFSTGAGNRTVFLCLRGALPRAVPLTGGHQKSREASFSFIKCISRVCVSVAMSLLLPRCVVVRNTWCKGILCFLWRESHWPAPLINTCHGKARPVLRRQRISIQVWLHKCLARGMLWHQAARFLAPNVGKFGLHKKASPFPPGGWRQGRWLGESKNAALGLLQDLVLTAHGYKLSRCDRCVLVDDPLAPAVKIWWLCCCEGVVPIF